MSFDSLIRSRKSVKEFKNRMPDWRDIIEAIDAARFAPMAGNNYTLKFIVVDDLEIIKKLAEYSQQDFVAQTYYVVVVCSDHSRTVNAFGKQGEHYSTQQAGGAMQNFWLKLVEKGLSTCWVGHFVENLIKKELKIPEHVRIEALFPIGYEFKKSSEKKAKIELDNILYFNSYGDKKMRHPKKIEV